MHLCRIVSRYVSTNMPNVHIPQTISVNKPLFVNILVKENNKIPYVYACGYIKVIEKCTNFYFGTGKLSSKF